MIFQKFKNLIFGKSNVNSQTSISLIDQCISSIQKIKVQLPNLKKLAHVNTPDNNSNFILIFDRILDNMNLLLVQEKFIILANAKTNSSKQYELRQFEVNNMKFVISTFSNLKKYYPTFDEKSQNFVDYLLKIQNYFDEMHNHKKFYDSFEYFNGDELASLNSDFHNLLINILSLRANELMIDPVAIKIENQITTNEDISKKAIELKSKFYDIILFLSKINTHYDSTKDYIRALSRLMGFYTQTMIELHYHFKNNMQLKPISAQSIEKQEFDDAHKLLIAHNRNVDLMDSMSEIMKSISFFNTTISKMTTKLDNKTIIESNLDDIDSNFNLFIRKLEHFESLVYKLGL